MKSTYDEHAVPGKKAKLPQMHLVGNKIDLIHLRKVSEDMHERFIYENKLTGGFTMSAQSGDNVLKTFYKVAAESAGIKLSAYELAFQDKCLTASVVDYDDSAETDVAAQIAAEDAAAMAKAQDKGCVCSVM